MGASWLTAQPVHPRALREGMTSYVNKVRTALYVLLVGTGLRRGEALALTWRVVDLDAGAVRVSGTLARVGGQLVTTAPKTAKSRRSVPLPTPVIAALRAHRARQATERLRAGSEWSNATSFSVPVSGHPSTAQRAPSAEGGSGPRRARTRRAAHSAALRGHGADRLRNTHARGSRAARTLLVRDHR